MHFGIISGSHQLQSQSEKIAKYIATKLQVKSQETSLISLAGNPFPLYSEDKDKPSEIWQEAWTPTSHKLHTCDGFVIVSPEWGGMVPAGLKNFFLLCEDKELYHKPAYIVTVSSGRGGSYPVAELRMSSYKNTHILYIPEQLIVRDCENVFNEGEPASKDDQYLRGRLGYGLDLLIEYTRLLQPLQTNPLLVDSKYPNGL